MHPNDRMNEAAVSVNFLFYSEVHHFYRRIKVRFSSVDYYSPAAVECYHCNVGLFDTMTVDKLMAI